MKKIALCIGNDAYEILPPLTCCVNDAKSIDVELRELGFDTVLKTNLNRADLNDAIFGFLEQVSKYDVVLIYYAGHGFQVDNDNILAPIDLNTNDRPGSVRLNSFTISELMNQLNDFTEQTKIIILDACRETLGHRGTFQGFAPISAPQGSIIAFSTSPGQSSKENSAISHGRYTHNLLKYISLPRVPAETVFKKVRENLAAETAGTQISWEHTSLIGEFYFNPNTIYDGVSYSWEAKADCHFHFYVDSEVKGVVEGLKTHSWPYQEDAIKRVGSINFEKASSNELFVLGRNIYQAACGNSFACQRFIDSFSITNRIPVQAKLHILNGMAYEIYYDSNNNIRENYKLSHSSLIIKYLEQPEFYASREFIASHLCKLEERPIYIPGQNEVMYFIIKIKTEEDKYLIDDIIYQGKSVMYNRLGTEKFTLDDCEAEIRRFTFEQYITSSVAAPNDCVKFQYSSTEITNETFVMLPYEGLSIRYQPRVIDLDEI